MQVSEQVRACRIGQHAGDVPRPVIAPLFQVSVCVEQRDSQWIGAAESEPEFNLSIVAGELFDMSAKEEIDALVGEGLPFGDAAALVQSARNIAEVLDVGVVSDLDPQSLHRQCDVAPGVYNAALWILANDGRGASQSLRDELDELARRQDWTTTAAACLVPDRPHPAKRAGASSTNPLAAPLPCNGSQESALDRFRRKPLTIVTGPPGTGKTQLVVNAVTNAWLDGETVLVASTNNGAVNVTAVAELNRKLAETVEDQERHAQRLWKRDRAPDLDIPSRVIERRARRVRRTWFFRGTRTRRLLTAVTGERSDTSLDDLARWAALDQTRTALMEKLSETEGRIGDPGASLRRADAPDPHQPIVLDEHYRCHPHIARWFNRVFYDGSLTVLTDVARMLSNERRIGWIDVRGEVRRGGAGSWTNIAEAEVAVLQIAAMVRHAGRSVGVVTPFSAQAALIQRLARRDEQLGDERLDAADFCCGTAHRFQGGERDTIVFSAVLTPGIPQRTAAWVEREKNLINVAVSRARQSLVVLGHPEIDAELSPTLASLRSYLRQISTDDDDDVMRPAIDEIRTDSQAEARLLDAMRDAGFQPRGKLYVQGYELDFALQEHGLRLNVEVDGDHHVDARGKLRRQDLARDRILAGIGWEVIRIPAWRCSWDVEAAIRDIRARLPSR